MNPLKLKALMAMGFAMALSSAHAEIISVKTMKSVQSRLEAALETHKAEDIWVAFDIDMTLIQSDHPAVCYPAIKKYRDIFGLVFEKLSCEQGDIVNALIVQTLPQKLVEEDTPRIVRDLQEKGVKTFAFTATLTGKISAFREEIISLRKRQLQTAGLDFTKSFGDFPPCTSFTEFPPYVGSYPLFDQGILSSNGERKISKGQTLVAFLKHLASQGEEREEAKARNPASIPKIIILVDDRRKNLLDVEKSLSAYNPSIQFIGIEYQGAYSYAPHPVSREDFQAFWEGMAEKARAETCISAG